MIVRELLARLGIDTDRKSFEKADGALRSMSKLVGGLATAFAGVQLGRFAVDAVASTVDAGAAVQDLSDKTGLGVEALQELQYAAKLSGVEIDTFNMGVSMLGTLVGDAAGGSEEAAKKFAALGLRIRDAGGRVKSTEVLLGEIADRMQGASSDAERLRMATDLFGGRGRNFVVALRNGSSELNRMRQEARDLGVVMSRETVADLAELDDNLDRLRFSWKAAIATGVKEALPVLLQASAGFVRMVKALGGVGNALRNGVRMLKEWGRRVLVTSAIVLGALALWKGSFLLFSAALWTVNGGFVALGVRAVASAVATGAAWLAAQIPIIAMHALVLGVAALFVGLVVAVVLLGQEIAAVFTKTDGLFEKLSGKWGDLTEAIFQDLDTREPGIIKVLEYAVALVTSLIAGIDELTGGLAKSIATMSRQVEEQGGLGSFLKNTAIETAGTALFGSDVVYGGGFGGTVTASPATRAARAAAPAAPNVSLEVNIDASGQSMDEERLGNVMQRAAADVLDRHLANTLSDMTPAVP